MVVSIKKVLISDEVDERCVTILQENGIEAVKNTKLSKEDLVKEIQNYDGLIVRSATKVTAEVINAGSRLKIIGRAGTGVDNIDVEAATKRGVIVMNTPGGNTMSAAELTCIMLLVTSRHVADGCASLKAGRWDRKKYMGNEVLGKTLAIVGLGRIGREVATRMQSFGMTTIGYDPILSAEEAAEFDAEWMKMDELWPKADYITVHTPLIPQTKNLINDEVFSKCKKGVRIVNVARGGIVDEDALVRALESGKCAGAGLDVFATEPPEKDSALIDHPLVTCTPHLGASTQEAQSRVAMEIAEQFVDVTNGKSLFGAINAQAMMNALSDDTKPLVELGGCLGKVARALGAQLNEKTEVKVVTAGKSVHKAGSFLAASALVGLLDDGDSVHNLVSAPAHAKSIGAKVSNSHHGEEAEDYSPLITLTVSQLDGSSPALELGGTVLHCMPALVSVNGASLGQAYQLHGTVLLYKSKAEPKVLADVTGAICEQGSCMLSLSSTTASQSTECYTLMTVNPPLAKPLDALKLHVTSAAQIRF